MDLNELLKQHQIAVMNTAAGQPVCAERQTLVARYAQAIGDMRMASDAQGDRANPCPATITIQPATS